MNKVDLNIDNYSYENILELFHLDYNFDMNELKSAKKIVLQTHPDKSKLPKEYFLFYSKAYKMLYYVYEFRLKSKKNEHDEYVNMTKDMFNIQLVTCPNKDPLAEIKKIGYDSIDVLDIDVDYFSAMQSECYTPMKKTIPSDLGNLTRCLKIIKKVKPKTITLSEATIDALNNPNSNTNLLLKKLENLGYERENFFLFDDDKTAKENLKKWEDFDKFYNENKQCDVESDFSSADVELGNLANQFFK